MIIGAETELRTVHGISESAAQRIHDFLQGAVYSWCKNRKGEWFGLRDLVGGDNLEWQGTPLIPLYELHEGEEGAIQSAGKACGWLLKSVIAKDGRRFETRKAELTRQYRWLTEE